MSCYILCNPTGEIVFWDAQPFPGSTLADYDVVRGWDGKLYKANEVPAQPGKTVNEKIADIEAEYQNKLADLDASLLAVLWADGANEVANRQALSAKRQQLTADKTAAITNIFLNG